MQTALKIMLMYLFMLSHAHAAEKSYQDLLHQPYEQARASLISQGWRPFVNKKIDETSLYAQEVAAKGFTEVLNCISMERDQCEFLLQKNHRYIIVTTKEKALEVESVKFQRGRAK